jgi:hypothetical protein
MKQHRRKTSQGKIATGNPSTRNHKGKPMPGKACIGLPGFDFDFFPCVREIPG